MEIHSPLKYFLGIKSRSGCKIRASEFVLIYENNSARANFVNISPEGSVSPQVVHLTSWWFLYVAISIVILARDELLLVLLAY